MQFYDSKSTLPLLRRHRLVLLGGGSGVVPTVSIGHGVTLSLTATGRVLVTWADNPGKFCGVGSSTFRDNTSQATVKGWTLTAGAYPQTASTFTLELDFWSSTFAAVDLATTSLLDVELEFSELSNP